LTERRTLVLTAVCALGLLTASPAYARDHEPASAVPRIVLRELDNLRPVSRVEDLPEPIRDGTFDRATADWRLAEPGAAWNATDVVIDSRLPFRRLIVAACRPTVCVIHYEKGGIAHIYLLVAFVRQTSHWAPRWCATGSRPIRDIAEIRSIIRSRSNPRRLFESRSCGLYAAIGPDPKILGAAGSR